jgi:large subunit ribosomal protein L22
MSDGEKKGFSAKASFLIAADVRRKPYSEAIAMLEAMPHKGARVLRKVIASAAANALYNNKKLDEDMLYIRELQIDEGPRMKRIWPRGRGRADRLMKRMSHIKLVLGEIAEAGGSRGTKG